METKARLVVVDLRWFDEEWQDEMRGISTRQERRDPAQPGTYDTAPRAAPPAPDLRASRHDPALPTRPIL